MRWIPCPVSLADVACRVAVAVGLAVIAGAAAIGAGAAPGPPSPTGPVEDEVLYDAARVRAYDFTFETRDWEAALNAAGDTGNAPARLDVDGRVAERVGVRYKGLSSMLVGSRKKPLNVSVDALVPGQRLYGYDVINLNNGYSDPSYVRESLMTEALRPFMPTQQTAYARVSVNGQYLGLYLAVEQVEGTFVSHWFPGSDGILVKADPPAGPGMGATTFHSALEWEGEDPARYRTLYEVKTRGAEQAGLVAIREAARILDAPASAGGASDAELPTAIARVLDVDRALWYLAANNLFVNYDSYYFGHNYFLYRAEEDGLLHLLMWDTSLSFGDLDLGAWGTGGAGTHVDPLAMDKAEDRPVLRRLLAVPEWRADYLAHYRVLLTGALDPDMLAARGEALQALARPALASDPNRLFTLDQFERNLRYDVAPRANMGPGGKAPGVVGFARERADWLAARPALKAPDHRLDEHRREPEAPRPSQAAAVTLRFEGADAPASVRLVYRVNRGAPAAVELAAAGDSWHGEIPGQAAGSEVTYYARVALPGGRSAFHPDANLAMPWRYTVHGPDLPLAPAGGLVINELMADNEATVADDAGEYDDWLELYNGGPDPIQLSTFYLGPSADDPWRYRLPDVTLDAGDFYLVWCDKDPEQGANHAPFKLAKEGDEVRLSSREATLDVVSFGPLGTDVSRARVPDGAGAWTTCESPTPRRANRCGGAPPPTGTPRATATPTAAPTASPGVTPTRKASPTPPGAEPSRTPDLPVGICLPVAYS
jgi:hypothetical protein